MGFVSPPGQMKRPTRITRPPPTRSNSAQQLRRPGGVIYTTNGFTRLSSEQDHCSRREASCFGSLPVDHGTTIAP